MLFLFGAVLGVLLTLGAFWLGHRRSRGYHRDPMYAAARYAVARHLKTHGALSVATLRHTLQIPNMTTQRYLDQMEQEGLLKRHGHDAGTFYTRS